jgi:uncharacterized protein YjbI with pentapeptide repeats
MKKLRPLPTFTWLAAIAVLLALLGVFFGSSRTQQIARETERIRSELLIENDPDRKRELVEQLVGQCFRYEDPDSFSKHLGEWFGLGLCQPLVDIDSPKGVNLSLVPLENERLDSVDFYRANLVGIDLQDSQLQNADLRDAILVGARLQDANLRGADLAETDLNHADLSEAGLQNATLTRAMLQHATLRNALLNQADLRRAMLANTRLDGAHFDGADLSKADLSGAMGDSQTDFTDAVLDVIAGNYLDLPGARLINADFRSANLTDANFNGADLRAVDFSGANLADAHFQGADLHSANFSGADLTSADLSNAELHSANFSGAIMRGTDLTRAQGLTSDQFALENGPRDLCIPEDKQPETQSLEEVDWDRDCSTEAEESEQSDE